MIIGAYILAIVAMVLAAVSVGISIACLQKMREWQ